MYLIPMLSLVDIPALVVCCEENPEIVELSRLWTAASWAALLLIATSSLTIHLLVDYFFAVNSAKVVMTLTD